MAKEINRTALILKALNKKNVMSCQQITDYIVKVQGLTDKYKIRYLPASISSKLAKLVKEGVLRYAKGKSIHGGHLYEHNI